MKYRKKYITFLLIVFIFMFGFNHSLSAASLTQEQVSAILNMLRAFGADSATIENVRSALLGGGATVNTTANTSNYVAQNSHADSGNGIQGFCPRLYRDLYRGLSGNDVLDLQVYLRYTGDYSYPKVTGYFGKMTEEAVKSYQARNGIVSYGSPSTTGYGRVGPSTRRHILNNCNKTVSNYQTYANLAQDFNVTPKIGSAPFLAAASFSYKGSNCTSFTLDWGDGTTPIKQYASNTQSCDDYIVKKIAKHTYTSNGTYAVTLKINRLGVTRTYTEQVNVGKLLASHFDISPTSGLSPLLVGASFMLPDNTCSSYKVDWGDGNFDSEIGKSTNCESGAIRPRSVIHTYKNPGTYIAKLYIGEGESLQLVEQREIIVKESSGANLNKEVKVSVSNTHGAYPLPVRVVIAGSGKNCVSYSIDWGDGTSPQIKHADNTDACTMEYFTQEFVHTYFIPGTYTLKIKAGKKNLNEIPIEYHYVTVTDK